ncbi:MAG: hypothetical protein LAN62_01265 [Acidobacteriia bacterium]|nr:hypothetical protein [Terriglobia bacterium]
MQQSHHVWRWASGILAAACLALVALNLLPPPPQNVTAERRPSADETAAATADPGLRDDGSGATAEKRYVDRGAPKFAELVPSRADSGRIGPLTDKMPADRNRARLEASLSHRDDPGESVPKSHTASAGSEVLQPLGYVEMADGRVETIVQQGEWIQFATEGERPAKTFPAAAEVAPYVEVASARETRALSRTKGPERAGRSLAASGSPPPQPPEPGPQGEDSAQVGIAGTGFGVKTFGLGIKELEGRDHRAGSQIRGFRYASQEAKRPRRRCFVREGRLKT